MSKNKKLDALTTKQNQPQLNPENNNDQKAIAAILSSYATQLVDLSKLNDDDKKKKEHNLEQAAKILADSLGTHGLLQNILVTQLLGCTSSNKDFCHMLIVLCITLKIINIMLMQLPSSRTLLFLK